MAESEEVAPPTAEENSGLVSLASEIAEAAGVDSFIENASETEAETEVEEEVLEEEIPDEPAPESTGDSDGVKKRIGKLIEARTKAEEERDALKAQLEEIETPARQSYKEEGMQKFEEVRTYEELDQREQDAEHLRDWLLENPDGGDYTDLSGEEHEVEYDSARQLMVATDRDLRKNIPAVKQKLQLRQQNQDLALKTFPWMKNKESSQHVKMVQLLEQNKELGSYFKKDPAAMITMGFIMEGFNSQNSKQSTQPAPAPQVPSAPSRATTSVVKKKVGNDKKSLLEQARSGDVNDAASYIETLL